MTLKATGPSTRAAFELIEQDLPAEFATPMYRHRQATAQTRVEWIQALTEVLHVPLAAFSVGEADVSRMRSAYVKARAASSRSVGHLCPMSRPLPPISRTALPVRNEVGDLQLMA